jgi:hypothetical protein
MDLPIPRCNAPLHRGFAVRIEAEHGRSLVFRK